jgi:DNA invertase Pin-like site-specific DNA recombinase
VKRENNFTDKLPGDISNRPALRRCLKKLEPGDTLIV